MAREGARFDNQDAVTLAAFSTLIVSHESIALFDPLGVQGVLDQAVDLDHDRLDHFSSDHCALSPFNPLPH
jgi:hypothetical protein